MSKIEEKVESLVSKTINDLGYSIYDIMYVKEGKDYYLRIFIDNENGISLNDCEKVNDAITDMLDSANYIKDQYFLEISSPGIERNIRTDKHLQLNLNEEINVKLFKAIEKKKEKIEKERLYKELNLDKEKNTIVFDKEKNTGIKILNFITDLIIRMIKFTFILLILVLLTIGATVIINPELRDELLKILQSFNFLT